MQIRHQSPNPDTEQKVSAILRLETPHGENVAIESWSLSAMTWPHDGPERPKTGTLTVPFQGVDIRFPVRLEPCPHSPDLLFKGLSGRQRETLSLFYRSLLSGRMASSEEVITSLDTPLDLVPMEQTEGESAGAVSSIGVRILRTVIHVATYVVIAAFVVGVIGNNILTNLDRIDIQHGRVSAPIADLTAARGGYVAGLSVVPGMRVTAGQVLLNVQDPEYVAEQAKAELDFAAAQAEVADLEAALGALEQLATEPDVGVRLAGASRMFEEYADTGRFEDMRRRWINLRDRDPAAAASFDPLLITRRLLSSQLDLHRRDVEKRQADLEARRRFAASTQIVAQEDGVVTEVFAREGQFLTLGEPALSLETADQRQTVGWVSERFAETIYIGMPAMIGFNEGGRRERIGGTIVDVQAGDHPERPGEFGIIVTVSPDGLGPSETRKRLRVGAPVNLEAERQIYARLKAWLISWVPDHA
ncbi:HlyD family secretion protein [Thalassococcus sp. S3]|uniref:HlyD family secretion protein n=1 Tax=Thalassococcus sp. S3 TaxID=2017482 RepID=UPI0010243CF1|nr:HlyD family efflux transporter periplasmic adaptor subunit [Thalassococcus sp. S3]QBF30828.1 hypothetical protein CFI11_06310 [Thalassococcus sp. S3]